MSSYLSSYLEDHTLHRDHNSSPFGRRTRLMWSTNCSVLLLFSEWTADTPYMK